MKNLVILVLFFFAFQVQAQNLPDDILDTNSVFIFNPSISLPNTREITQHFCTTLLTSGVNLVGKHFYHDNQPSLKEIEFDVNNKAVKYIFLLTITKEDSYSMQLYENVSANFNTLNPKKILYTFGPESEKNLIKKIDKDLSKVKTEKAQLINTEDKDLFNSLVLSTNEIQSLKILNDVNTIIGGSLLEIKTKATPTDLKENKLAIIGITLDEYNREFRRVNSVLILKTKGYPFEYKYFQTYKEYKDAGGDTTYKYRLQLSKQDEIDLSSVKPVPVNPGKISKPQTRHDYSFVPINYSKENFTLILKDNQTKQKYIVSNKNILAQAIKEFIDAVKPTE